MVRCGPGAKFINELLSLIMYLLELLVMHAEYGVNLCHNLMNFSFASLQIYCSKTNSHNSNQSTKLNSIFLDKKAVELDSHRAGWGVVRLYLMTWLLAAVAQDDLELEEAPPGR